MAEKFQRWDEAKLIIDTYTKVWAIFVTWFTWFFAINIGAMSYIAVTDKPIRADLIFPLCLFMSICVIFGVTASFMMGLYNRQCTKRIKHIVERIEFYEKIFIDSRTIIANPVIYLATWLITISLLWTLGAWVFIAFWAAHRTTLLLGVPLYLVQMLN